MGYLHDAFKPLILIMPEMSGYVNIFEDNKLMSFVLMIILSFVYL